MNGDRTDTERENLGDPIFQCPPLDIAKLWPFTHANAAIMFARYYQDKLMFVPQTKGFFRWTGRLWEEDTAGDIASEAMQQLSLRLLRHASQMRKDADSEDAGRIAKFALQLQSTHEQRAALAQAGISGVNKVQLQTFDADAFAFNCANGIIDLRTGELRRHDPKELHSKISPITYDPNAGCARFFQFLEEVFIQDDGEPDRELIAFMQRFLGYTLTGDAREECVFFWYGLGRNGKSKLREIIEYILGSYAIAIGVETLTQRRRDGSAASGDVARLVGMRLASASESDRGILLNEALIKNLTGRDRVVARRLYRDEFEFTPAFKLVLSTNHRPEVRGTDDGIWRRIVLTPFLARFVKGVNADLDIGAKLKAEAPGILAWMVRGCLEWQKVGLQPPASVQAATIAYRTEMSIVNRFVNDCCVLTPGARVLGPQLYGAFQQWSAAAGERKPLTSRALFAELRKTFAQQVTEGPKRHGQIHFFGIGLHDPDRDPPSEPGDEVTTGDEINELLLNGRAGELTGNRHPSSLPHLKDGTAA